ncbi:MAG: hypothetical protein AABX52_02695 [Nanoarchaeota archaeon]|mgnify:CR=1 FL=1
MITRRFALGCLIAFILIGIVKKIIDTLDRVEIGGKVLKPKGGIL